CVNRNHPPVKGFVLRPIRIILALLQILYNNGCCPRLSGTAAVFPRTDGWTPAVSTVFPPLSFQRVFSDGVICRFDGVLVRDGFYILNVYLIRFPLHRRVAGGGSNRFSVDRTRVSGGEPSPFCRRYCLGDSCESQDPIQGRLVPCSVCVVMKRSLSPSVGCRSYSMKKERGRVLRGLAAGTIFLFLWLAVVGCSSSGTEETFRVGVIPAQNKGDMQKAMDKLEKVLSDRIGK